MSTVSPTETTPPFYDSSSSNSPFVVPPFKARVRPDPIERYFWWSWHPLYPYWSKSCWGGATEQAARDILNERVHPSLPYTHGDGLDVYHNKLIRENEDGTLTEVDDMPCRKMDNWEKIAKQGVKPFPH